MSKKRPQSQRSLGTLEIRDKRSINSSSTRGRRYPSPPPVPPVDSETTEITQQISDSRAGAVKVEEEIENSQSVQPAVISDSTERVLVDTELPIENEVLEALSSSDQEILITIFTGSNESRKLEDATSSPRRALQRLIYAKEFLHLQPEFQTKLLLLITESREPLETIRQIHKLVCNSDIHELSLPQQKTVFDVFKKFSHSKKTLFAKIAQRRLGNRSMFVDTDFGDAPFVEILSEFIHQKELSATLKSNGFSHPGLVSEALLKLARPASLIRGKGGAGVLNTLEFALYSDAPAEILRYWNEITRDGMTIDLPSQRQIRLHKLTSFESGRGVIGTALEGLLSVAYPRGALTYDSLMMLGSHSIDVDILAKTLCELYGLEFRIITSPAKAITFLKSKPTGHFRIPPIFVALASDDSESLFVFDGYTEEYTFIRAPHGGSLKQAKEQRKKPPRIVVNPELGQDKIENAILQDAIRFVLAPKT